MTKAVNADKRYINTSNPGKDVILLLPVMFRVVLGVMISVVFTGV